MSVKEINHPDFTQLPFKPCGPDLQLTLIYLIVNTAN